MPDLLYLGSGRGTQNVWLGTWCCKSGRIIRSPGVCQCLRMIRPLPAGEGMITLKGELLVKAEAHLHTNLHVHRPAIFESGLEAPLLHCFYGFCIQSKSQATNDTNVARMPLVVDD